MGVLSVVLALLLSSTLSSFWNKLVSQSTPVGFFFFFFLEEREVYCRAVQGEWGLMPPNPELPEGFQQSIFKGKVREEGCRVCSQLVHSSLIG